MKTRFSDRSLLPGLCLGARRLSVTWASLIGLFLIFVISYSSSLRIAYAQEINELSYDEDGLASSKIGLRDSKNAELDLDSIVREAVGNNPEITAARRKWEASKTRIKKVKSLADPMLRIGAVNSPNHPFNIGAEAVKNAPIMSPLTIGISQKIPFPGKLRLRGKSASEGAEMGKMAMEGKAQEVVANVKHAYYELYLIHKSIKISGENRDLLKKFTKIAEAMYSVGKASQRDVLASMVELSKIENGIIALSQKKKSAEARINSLLGRTPDSFLGKPREFEKHKLRFPLQELEKMAIENRPMLQKSDHAVKKSGIELELAKKDYFSDFTAMIEYRRIGEFPSDTWASALSINIPWLWSKQKHKVKEAKEELSASVAEREAINNMTLFQIRDIVSMAISAESTIDLFKKGVIPQAEQSLKAARVGYETGENDFMTLIDSQRTLLDAKLQYYRALVQYEQNIARLEMVVGVELAG